jgi:hypothetical protein
MDTMSEKYNRPHQQAGCGVFQSSVKHMTHDRQQLLMASKVDSGAHETMRPSATSVIVASQNGIPLTVSELKLCSDMSARSREFNVAGRYMNYRLHSNDFHPLITVY